MVKTSEILEFARAQATSLVVPAILKSLGFGVAGGILFFIAGMVVYFSGIAPALQNSNFVIRIVLWLIVVGTYTALGAIATGAIGAVKAVTQGVSAAETRAQDFFDPVIKDIVTRIPGGQSGISPDEFRTIVDDRIAELSTSDGGESGLSALPRATTRFVLRHLLAITRAVLLEDFLTSMASGEDQRITVQLVEAFARGKLMKMVTSYVQLKLGVVRKIATIAVIVGLLIPLLLIVF